MLKTFTLNKAKYKTTSTHTNHPTVPNSTENFQFFLEAKAVSLKIFLKTLSAFSLSPAK